MLRIHHVTKTLKLNGFVVIEHPLGIIFLIYISLATEKAILEPRN
jgi:hypothetical protein